MNNQYPQPKFSLMRVVKKLFLSAFVVGTFIAYAIHKPSDTTSGKVGAIPPTNGGAIPTQPLVPTSPAATATAAEPPSPQQAAPTFTAPAIQIPQQAAATATAPATAAPAAAAAAPVATATAPVAAGYKDGTYTGPQVDAWYGVVQVQAVIQNGKIANVQFLSYPNDRRTSVRINSYAVPTLQQEAVQAQSANVDIITGATLTSQAFQQSLQAALQKAGG